MNLQPEIANKIMEQLGPWIYLVVEVILTLVLVVAVVGFLLSGVIEFITWRKRKGG